MDERNSHDIERLFDHQREMAVNLAKLTENVSTGFTGVHQRQDIANGRLSKLELDTQDIDGRSEENNRRLESLESLHGENRRTRKWVRREAVALVLQAISTIILAWVALKLGLR